MHRFVIHLAMAMVALGFLLPSLGCFELAQIISDSNNPIFNLGDSGLPTDGFSGDDGGSSGGEAPVVSLRASNTSPAVNEEVVLTCLLTRGDRVNLEFGFQPNSGRVVVDPTVGTARLIITEADLGASFSFTCSATNAFGTSPPSNRVLIIPFGQP